MDVILGKRKCVLNQKISIEKSRCEGWHIYDTSFDQETSKALQMF